MAGSRVGVRAAAPRPHRRRASWLPWLILAALAILGGVAIALASRRRRAKQLLHEAHERADQAFQEAAIGIALVALDGRWLRVNPRLCAMLGYGEAELLAMTTRDVMHPDDLEAGGLGLAQPARDPRCGVRGR